MNLNTRNKLLIFSFFIFTSIAVVGYIYYKIFKNLHKSEKELQQTEKLDYQLVKINLLTKQIEFAIQSNISAKALSFPAIRLLYTKTFHELDMLKTLIHGDSAQTVRIDSIISQLNQYSAFSSAIKPGQYSFELQSKNLLQITNKNLSYAGRLSKLFDDFNANEHKVLINLRQTNEHYVVSSTNLLIFTFSLIILILILLLIILRNYLIQIEKKEDHSNQLLILNKKLSMRNEERKQHAEKLKLYNSELVNQNIEKEQRADELVIANKELAYQNSEKEDRAKELVIANRELAYQNSEKEERAKELVIANSKLELQNREKEKLTADVMQRGKNLEQFSHIVSHNLRGPVANILGIANLLKGPIADIDRDKIQQFLFIAVEQLDEVVTDLGRILQMMVEITELSEPVVHDDIVEKISYSIENLIRKENVQIITDFSAINHIMSLKTYMHSIFYNLISNSIKYKQRNQPPIIHIKSTLVNDSVQITFQDNGIGIDMNMNREKVFGLYKRFHDNVDGKGLGLYMVKNQVEILGGNISIESYVNQGTQFTVELPIN